MFFRNTSIFWENLVYLPFSKWIWNKFEKKSKCKLQNKANRQFEKIQWTQVNRKNTDFFFDNISNFRTSGTIFVWQFFDTVEKREKAFLILNKC